MLFCAQGPHPTYPCLHAACRAASWALVARTPAYALGRTPPLPIRALFILYALPGGIGAILVALPTMLGTVPNLVTAERVTVVEMVVSLVPPGAHLLVK